MSPTLLQSVAKTVAARDASGRVAELFYLLRAVMASRGSMGDARNLVGGDHCAPQRVVDTLKAAVPANVLAGSGLEATKWIVSAFNEALRSVSAFDAMLADNAFIRIPIDTRGAMITTSASAGEVGEGLIKFVSQPVVVSQNLRPRKTAGIVVVSEELVRSSVPTVASTLGRELTGAVGRATDTAFVATLIAAGITASATAGATAANTLTDISTLLTNVAPRASSKLYFWTTPTVAAKLVTRGDTAGTRAFPLSTPTGGELAGVPLLVSDGVPAGYLLLVDGSRIIANADAVELDFSEHAMLAMNDTPDSPVVASTVLTSLWQHNLVALRADRYFGAEALSTNAAAAITGL